MILVVGATGLLGSEICRRLAERGQRVRGLVRPSSDAARVAALRRWGVEIVEGDLKEPDSLVPACAGVDAVITTAASTLRQQPGDSIESVDKKGQISLVDAAIAAGVERYVYISVPAMRSIGAFPVQESRRAVEAHLQKSKMRYTALRPSWFMEVWMAPAVGFDFPNGRARIFGSGEAKISWIAIPDLAEIAIRSLDDDHVKNALIEVGGPEGVSFREAVAIFEEESGRKFELEVLPEQALEAQLAATEHPLQRSVLNLMLNAASGHLVDMSGLLRAMPLQMTTVRDYARRALAEPLA